MTLVFLIALLVVFAVSYIAYFGLVTKPERSVYAYLVIWMTLPKALRLFYVSGGSYDLPEGLTVFHIVEAIAICAIGVALIKRQGKRRLIEKTDPLRRFTWLLLGTATISLILSFGFLSLIVSTQLDDLWSYLDWHIELQYRILPYVSILYGAIFLYGCLAFITELRQVEMIFLFFLLLGLGMGVESFVFYYLPSFTNITILPSLTAWSINQAGGRFMSLIFSSYDQVGLFSLIAIACCVYFSLSRKKKGLLLLLPLLFMPIIAGYQRSVLLGVLATLVFIYWHTSTSRDRVVYVCLATTVLLTIYLFDSDMLLLSQVTASLGGSTRVDYMSTESLDARLGLQIRAFEVFLHAFPFGVGPGMVPTAMNSPIRESMFGYNFPQLADYSSAIYGQVASGVRTTNPHNIFLEFVVEHGLLGIVVLVLFIYLILRNFLGWLKSSRLRSQLSSPFLAQACLYALLLGIGIHEMLESTFLPFALYLMFLYFTFLLPQLTVPATQDRSEPTADLQDRLATAGPIATMV